MPPQAVDLGLERLSALSEFLEHGALVVNAGVVVNYHGGFWNAVRHSPMQSIWSAAES
jgi:hypothetical protein